MQQHPLPEYPARPCGGTAENLNGLWQYAMTAAAEAARKVGRRHSGALLPGDESLRGGPHPAARPVAPLSPQLCAALRSPGGRVLLHFGAVDYACAVQVNGRLVGGHRGGYWPFTLDITDALSGTGRDQLWVAVQDPTGTGTQARGKQTLNPGGMFYPAQSGIWQTVWLERVPDNLHHRPDGHPGLRAP